MHKVTESSNIVEGELFSATVADTRLLLSRFNGQVKGVIDKCTHLGMPMRKGKFDGRVITCPFHGSRFDVATGENLDWVSGVMGMKMPKWVCKAVEMGKQPAPLATLRIEERDGAVYADW